mmetsp:Transcript_5919/g.9657  ORF Transcript_5919/g.9657 Transcript_5919/m.9657 type:complete len:105 (+) Transcript_5919:694-1008(+)
MNKTVMVADFKNNKQALNKGNLPHKGTGANAREAHQVLQAAPPSKPGHHQQRQSNLKNPMFVRKTPLSLLERMKRDKLNLIGQAYKTYRLRLVINNRVILRRIY